MQQRPDAMRDRRTQPAVPGATLPTAPAVARNARASTVVSTSPKRAIASPSLAPLLYLALLIEVCLSALLPLFIILAQPHDQMVQAVLSRLPWLPRLFWSTHFPLFTYFSWLSPQTSTGTLHLIGLLLAIMLLCAWGAAWLGWRLMRKQLAQKSERTILFIGLAGSALFGLTLLIIPVGLSQLSQNMPFYGLYGSMIRDYHVTPYAPASFVILHNFLYQLVKGQNVGISATAPYGPVWFDFCLLVVLFTKNSIANVLLGFRLLGLLAHVANALLLWIILGKVKPEARAAGMLLYAWNPLVLVFSVLFMQQEVVLVCCLLLAVFFFQSESPTLGWVLILLAALMNNFCIMLLPLFFRMLLRESRILYLRRRLLWWCGMACISALIVGLAYIPYIRGGAVTGMLVNLEQTFLPAKAINSLDATILNLPMSLPAFITWLLSARHWTILALVVEVCVLLLGFWLADTLTLALLFSSWLLLLNIILLPVYWPWYIIPPLALAICADNRRTIALTVLLSVGGLLGCYYELHPLSWQGQGLVILALPLLCWGWMLFFSSTWLMTRPPELEKPIQRARSMPSFSRPSWMSRPSRPGRG